MNINSGTAYTIGMPGNGSPARMLYREKNGNEVSQIIINFTALSPAFDISKSNLL